MKPMLACKYDEAKVASQLPVYAQPKLDGIRMIVKNGIGYSRSLKPIRSTWVQSLVSWNKHILEGYDGELIAGDPTAPDCYRRTSSAVMSFDNPDEDVRFFIFDKWNSDRPYDQRQSLLNLEYDSWESECHPNFKGRFTLLDSRYIETMEELALYEEEMLNLGHEGIILRNPDGRYKFGRATPRGGELIKVKQWLEAEARIIDVHEFLHNGNEAVINELGYLHHSGHKDNLVPMNKLGAFECRGKYPDGEEFTVRIGSGFDDAMRSEYWHRRADMIGRIVKFKYFGVGIKDKPRFPIFIGFRHEDDMDKEQLSML